MYRFLGKSVLTGALIGLGIAGAKGKRAYGLFSRAVIGGKGYFRAIPAGQLSLASTGNANRRYERQGSEA